MWKIRQVRMEDLPYLIAVEQQCFSLAEAATKEAFIKRIKRIPDSFFVAEAKGEVIGLINGPVIESAVITDDLFSEIKKHPPLGGYQSILGLAVAPNHQKQGIAKALFSHFEKEARVRKREAITLTCKKALLPFYERFGFTNDGVSDSVHGGVSWYNMSKKLQ